MTEKAAHFAFENEKIHFIEFISSTQAVLLGDCSLLSKALDVSPPSSSSPFDQTCYCCNYLHEQDMKPSSFEFIMDYRQNYGAAAIFYNHHSKVVYCGMHMIAP